MPLSAPLPVLVSIPAWGEWHVTACAHVALRSVRAALEWYPFPVRFLVHTDRSDFLRPAFRGLDVEFRPVPAHANFYFAMGNCHREALAAARSGEMVVLMCADQVVSREALVSCRDIIGRGAAAVFCAGPRAHARPLDAPVGAAARDLLAFALAHPHPWTRELVYGRGRARGLSLIYFQTAASTVAHGFHLHPFAVLNDRALTFRRATLDLDLIDCFAPAEIHVVEHPDELATIEISPLSKMIPLAETPFGAGDIAQWAHVNASPKHRWLFEHRIVLAGSGEDCGDTPVVAAVRQRLAALATAAAAA